MQFQTLIENLPVGICQMELDNSGVFLYVNPEFLDILGYLSIDDLSGIGMRDLHLNPTEWDQLYNDLLSRRHMTGVEVQLKDQGGSSLWASINARIVESDKSKDGAWIDYTVEDITSRKLAELRNISQMENLRQASLTLTASLDLKEVLDTIAQCALDLVYGMRNCHIFLYSAENGKKLIFGTALWGDGKRSQPFASPRPEGLTMRVAQSGQPIMVPDLSSDPLYADAPISWTGSIIGLPLKIGDRVVGVMNVSHTQPGAFTGSDIRMLRLLGDQAAIAIENARLYEALAIEQRHLSLVYDIGKEIAPSLDSGEILERAIRLTCQALGSSFGMAFIYLPEVKKLSWQSLYQTSQDESQHLNFPKEILLGEGLPGWIGLHRQAVNIPDINQDARWKDIPGWHDGMRSMLGAPIVYGDELMGVFTLFHSEPAAFSPDHLELFQAICYQVGVALSNVGRYEQVQHLVEMLEVEQERLTTLVERLPVGILLLNEDYHPVVVNSFASEILTLFGVSDCKTELSNLGPYSIPELIEGCDNPQPTEITLDESQSKIFEIETRPLGGERTHWVLMLREVTQERNDQSRIQMQDRLATVGQLAAGIAHDFNNVMATILVYSDLLRKDLATIPAGLERLAIIQHQVQRAASLIRQILDFSRRSVMEQSTLDVLPFIKEFDRLLERVLPETIRVELNYHPGSYPIHADPTRLQQVLMNLAVNARDAMPDGGILSFNIDRVQLGPGDYPPSPYLPVGDWVSITVGDTGVGIPAEAIPHIYEPFFTTKPVGQGTGLGLAQAYGIVKQHEGYIDVQSHEGEGTKFTVYLPALNAEKVDIKPVPISVPVDGMGHTILVVEDDPTTLNAIQDLLEAQQYQVFTASNGNEAMRIFELNPDKIDLLVSDLVMPEMGGLALYNQVQIRWPKVKTLFVTGHPMGDERQSLLEENQITWLQKPFSVPEFFFAVEELLTESL
jgi:PAS domain S-box-containing protein